MRILAINEKSSFLEYVIALGRANANTLGFLPRGAFSSHATDGHILVALDKTEQVIGYLIYATSNKKRLAYIVHLCVKESHRRIGVARALFAKLRAATSDTLRGIRVHCRRDYEASAVWPKLGFAAVDEMAGRSKHGTSVTVWWFDHGHPTLFSYADEQRTEPRLKVAIDASVFFHLQEAPTPANEESQSLLADWLQENSELWVTKEILNEIDRHPDKSERERGRTFATRFSTLTSRHEEFQRAQDDLRQFFPAHMTTSDESDLRQLAWAATGGATFFVTRDDELLVKEDQIYEACGMRIIRPSDFVINQDHLMRETEYHPARLAGSQVKIERVHPGQTSLLEDVFRTPHEAKAKFRQLLRPCLADPRTFETSIVQSGERPSALIVHGRQAQKELEVAVFRIMRGPLAPTLARHLVLRTISISAGEGRVLTKVSEPCLSSDAIGALRDMGFVLTHGTWVKANLPVVETAEALVSRLSSLSGDFPHVGQYFQQVGNILQTASMGANSQVMLQLERALWPAKLMDLDIPAFVVPIRPEWAMHLFDPHIGSQDLFGGEPSLVLGVENVYYRARRPQVLVAPARILWYVSTGSGRYRGTRAIRASSYLDEVVVDRPKALFSRFRRLGVYKWEDVFRLAGNRADQEIMAFQFSGTEVFSSPIGIDVLQGIWSEEGKRFHIQSPVVVPRGRFFRIYKGGVGIR